ncbi:MAG: DoxX family protein [Parachlamydiales bacterium]|nr:DoxX family protein [Parachlamydiales bacterium]
MEFLQDIFSLVGRVLISGMFLWAAYEKITNWQKTVTYMKTKNVPQLKIVLPVGVGLKVLGGLMVLLGWHAHLGALLLLIVSIASLIRMHDWWKKQGAEREMEKLFFLKDLAIIGGLFMILALGAGHFGLGMGG